MEKPVKQADLNSKTICILGMHRSGTSAVARAINLLGVPLGEAAKMMPGTSENPEGYWEHTEINDLQKRLMARLQRSWDTVQPLPEGWLQSEIIRPFKAELARVVATNFGGQTLWGWKDPQTCLLLPLWREILEGAGTQLACLLVVRSPVDVANSLERRDAIPFDKAVGLWFLHNLTALKDAAGLPIVFLSYDRLLEAWEPELRRCAAALELDWPKDEQRFRESMNAFLQARPAPQPVVQRTVATIAESGSGIVSSVARRQQCAFKLRPPPRRDHQPAVRGISGLCLVLSHQRATADTRESH